MEEFSIVQGKKLRWGYTTGSCATAAAKAAAAMLLGDGAIVKVKVATPKGIILDLEVEDAVKTAGRVSCAVRKDAGDDFDDTNGILIYAAVEKQSAAGIELCGGRGVGRVTQPGLACKVGEPAINPTPAKMIRTELAKVCRYYNYSGGLKVTIFIPEGERLAQKTFNPRLGIVGGLSVLGTSGIVEPMSEKALVATIYTEVDIQAAKGHKDLLVFFGNYGEDYARDALQINTENRVTCSNFVGEILDYAVYKGFASLLLIGHSGKLVKVSQGVMNTHSKYADCRTDILALEAVLCGASRETAEKITQALTTDEAMRILRESNLLVPVMCKVMERIDYYMQNRVHGKIKTGALMFSNVYGVLGMTQYADELIALHRREQ